MRGLSAAAFSLVLLAALQGNAAALAPGEMGKARELAAAGEWDEAARIYSRILEKNPSDADARLARGRVFGWMGKFDRAESEILKVVEAFPRREDAWSALADVRAWAGSFRESAEASSRWIEMAPRNPEAYLARARALAAAGSAGQAREDLLAARKLGADRFLVAARIKELAGIEAHPWKFSAGAGYERVAGGVPDWVTFTAALARKLPEGSAEATLVRAKRSCEWENALGTDLYSNLWRGAYGSLRFYVSPGAEVLARSDFRSEVFQSFPGGWEASAAFRNVRYADSGADVYGAGAGKYGGDWYLRALGGLVKSRGVASAVWSGSARRYLAGPENFMEAAAGTQIESVQGYAGGSASASRSYFASGRVQVFVVPSLGFFLGVYFADGPDYTGRAGMVGGTIVRW